jgi:hypothetical protein
VNGCGSNYVSYGVSYGVSNRGAIRKSRSQKRTKELSFGVTRRSHRMSPEQHREADEAAFLDWDESRDNITSRYDAWRVAFIHARPPNADEPETEYVRPPLEIKKTYVTVTPEALAAYKLAAKFVKHVNTCADCCQCRDVEHLYLAAANAMNDAGVTGDE